MNFDNAEVRRIIIFFDGKCQVFPFFYTYRRKPLDLFYFFPQAYKRSTEPAGDMKLSEASRRVDK